MNIFLGYSLGIFLGICLIVYGKVLKFKLKGLVFDF